MIGRCNFRKWAGSLLSTVEVCQKILEITRLRNLLITLSRNILELLAFDTWTHALTVRDKRYYSQLESLFK